MIETQKQRKEWLHQSHLSPAGISTGQYLYVNLAYDMRKISLNQKMIWEFRLCSHGVEIFHLHWLLVLDLEEMLEAGSLTGRDAAVASVAGTGNGLGLAAPATDAVTTETATSATI